MRCCQANHVEFPRVSWNHSDHSGDTLPKPWMLDGAERPRFSREKIIISLVWQLGAASQLLIIMSYQSYIWVIYILHAYYCVIYIYTSMIYTHHYIYQNLYICVIYKFHIYVYIIYIHICIYIYVYIYMTYEYI